MRARVYHPLLRRFLTPDALLGSPNPGIALNRYAFANANPVSLIDPFGFNAMQSVDDFGRTPGDVGPSIQPLLQFGKGFFEGVWDLVYQSTPIPGAIQATKDLAYLLWSGQPPPTPSLPEALDNLVQAYSGPNVAENYGRLLPALLLSAALPLAAPEAVAAAESAQNVMNGVRLSQQLSAESMFAPTGGLSQEAIAGSTEIIPAVRLINPVIPQGSSKFTTNLFDTPIGPGQVHFYMNPATREIYYGLDYKFIPQSSIGR